MKNITKRKARQVQKLYNLIDTLCIKCGVPSYALTQLTPSQVIELDNVLKSYGLEGIVKNDKSVAVDDIDTTASTNDMG